MAPNAEKTTTKLETQNTYTSDKSYIEDTGSLKAQLAWRKKLKDAMAPEEYAFSARKRVLVHYWLGIRTFAMYFATAYLIWNYHDNPLIWIPAGFFQGQWLVNMIFLNHECVHQLVWNKRDSALKINIEYWTGRAYCFLPTISSTFFRAYHGMHHHQFFQGTDDPKSTHFVPKNRARSTRMKFWGPGLVKVFTDLRVQVMPVLPKDVQKAAKLEQMVNKTCHFLFMVWCIYTCGFSFWMKIHFIPHLFWFPVGFMINRCGQHYSCNPKDSALQSTNCIGNWFWDMCHLYSEYHVEHHTFAEVPAYNLKFQNSVLKENVYKKIDLPQFTFFNLCWGWVVQNRKVYTVWYDLATPYDK